MGLATQSEIDKAVIEAKKKLRDDEIMDVLRKCSYGGPITSKSRYKRLDCQGLIMKGGEVIGKTD